MARDLERITVDIHVDGGVELGAVRLAERDGVAPAGRARLGDRFVKAVFDERYGEFRVDVTGDKWCDRFRGVGVRNTTHL